MVIQCQVHWSGGDPKCEGLLSHRMSEVAEKIGRAYDADARQTEKLLQWPVLPTVSYCFQHLLQWLAASVAPCLRMATVF